MLQFDSLEEITEKDIKNLLDTIQPELNKRKELYKRYKRKDKNSDIIYSTNKKKTKVTFEKYITDISAGYLGGTAPKYVVNNTTDENKINIIRKILNKIVGQTNYKEEMEILIDYITNYNDDGAEHYQLVKDLLMTSACYEVIYENVDNEIIYTRLDPLQTMAVWDYNVPVNLVGLIRTWDSEDINGKKTTNVEIISKSGIKDYKTSSTGSGYELVSEKANNWKDVPAFAVEQEEGIAIFEPVVDIIEAYEQLIQNCRNTFQYNDEAKLIVAGYTPQNPLTIRKEILDEEGNITGYEEIENPARQTEDEACLKAKVIYLGEEGDVKWVEKNINDTAVQNTLKTYIDLLAMNTGVPNITDLGFTNADNASAIDRKFFALEQMTINVVKQLEKAYLRRWELIFDRINLKKKDKNLYDFRDITVILAKNVPQNNKEIVENWLKLRGLVSDETIIDNLPYDLDPNSEQKKMNDQEQEELEKEVNKMAEFNKVNQNEKEDLQKDENVI